MQPSLGQEFLVVARRKAMLPMVLKGWVELPNVARQLATCATERERGNILHEHFGANLASLYTLLGELAGLPDDLRLIFLNVRNYLDGAECTSHLHQLCFSPRVTLPDLMALHEQLCIFMVAVEDLVKMDLAGEAAVNWARVSLNAGIMAESPVVQTRVQPVSHVVYMARLVGVVKPLPVRIQTSLTGCPLGELKADGWISVNLVEKMHMSSFVHEGIVDVTVSWVDGVPVCVNSVNKTDPLFTKKIVEFSLMVVEKNALSSWGVTESLWVKRGAEVGRDKGCVEGGGGTNVVKPQPSTSSSLPPIGTYASATSSSGRTGPLQVEELQSGGLVAPPAPFQLAKEQGVSDAVRRERAHNLWVKLRRLLGVCPLAVVTEQSARLESVELSQELYRARPGESGRHSSLGQREGGSYSHWCEAAYYVEGPCYGGP